MPVQTSRYVGFGVWPAVYPTAVEYTPSTCQNLRSAPQKQPIANVARASPSGNGGSSGRPLTKCAAGTSIRSARPGSAPAFDGMLIAFLENIALLRLLTNGRLRQHLPSRSSPPPTRTRVINQRP